MAEAVELEIGVHRRDAKTWTVELRASLPGKDEQQRWECVGPAPDLQELKQHTADEDDYGIRLGRALFGLEDIGKHFGEVRAIADQKDVPLRLRLFIGQSALDLHDVRWEAIHDPDRDTPLLRDERIHFSRYLASSDWRQVTLGAKPRLRALVLVANPTNLSDFKPEGRELAPIDVAGELDRVRAALGPIDLAILASEGPERPFRAGGTGPERPFRAGGTGPERPFRAGGTGPERPFRAGGTGPFGAGSTGQSSFPRPTLANLVDALAQGCDILYVVCHGSLFRGEPQLLLEDDDGLLARVAGGDLVERLRGMRGDLPRLVVLASCQSASDDDGLRSNDRGALAALGPRLAEVRIPSVIAMQGNVSMDTVARFMPVFLKELQKDGQIDRAMARARGAVADRPDWWVPVLFMRLETGRLWYRPESAQPFQQWPALRREIKKQRCIVILGPALTDAMFGTRQDLAWRWSKEYGFPMWPEDREDLSRVAQYVAVHQNSPSYPHEELGEHLRDELLQRYGGTLPPGVPEEARHGPLEEWLDKLIKAVSHNLLQDPAEPHRVLAELPFTMYVTTQQANLMVPALVAAGKRPEVDYARWSDDVDWPPSIMETEPGFEPQIDRPLVVHLFGRLQQPSTMVLTEDNYLDYLIRVSKERESLPDPLLRGFCNSSLLFLGFRMNEMEFRVIHRIIMNQEGGERRNHRPHVAVQIAPEEGRMLEPRGARRYLESYFQGSHMSIFWGGVDEFARELQQQWALET